VHLRVPTPAAIFAFRMARARRKPIVLLVVGDYAALLPHLGYKGVKKLLFSRYVAFEEWALRYMTARALTFANGAALREKHERDGVRVHETRTTTLSLDDLASRSDTCAAAPIRLLTVSRIDPRKGLRTLPAVVHSVQAAGVEATVDIIGPTVGLIGESERDAIAAAAALVMLLPQAVNWRLAAQQVATDRPVIALPDLEGAPRMATEVPPLEPDFLKPSFMVTGAYSVRGSAVWVHVAYYRQQRFGSKLVSSQNVLAPSTSEKWQFAGRGMVSTQHRDTALEWRRTELLGGHVSASSIQRTRAEVRQVYWVNERFTGSDMRASLLGLWGKLVGQGDEGAMVTIYALGDPAATGPLLDSFTQQHLGAIEKALADHRARR
jgi:EpsI family protein